MACAFVQNLRVKELVAFMTCFCLAAERWELSVLEQCCCVTMCQTTWLLQGPRQLAAELDGVCRFFLDC